MCSTSAQGASADKTGVDGSDCLTAGQVTTVKKIYAGATATGRPFAYGGTRLPSGYGLMEPNFRFLALDNDDPAFSWKVRSGEILSPLDPDLRPFKKLGGKPIMYHGWSDPGISAARRAQTTSHGSSWCPACITAVVDPDPTRST